MKKIEIIYSNQVGRKETRTFQNCKDDLDAINKLIKLYTVKHIFSVKEISMPGLFTQEFLGQ